MNWIHWTAILIAPLAAVTCETIFRIHQGSYGQIATITIILSLIVNYGVFHIMKAGNSLIEGIVIWSFLTASFRILSTLFILKETPRPVNWVAFGMVIAATVLTRLWR